MAFASAKAPPAPKKRLGWRDLTDEQRWAKIYRDRAARRAGAPKTIKEAVKLMLPAALLHEAISTCHAKGIAHVRYDAHVAVVSSVAKIASLLQEKDREPVATLVERIGDTLEGQGFYLDEKEFLYAVASATTKLVDEGFYPADAPAAMAALVFKMDAEEEGNEWGLIESHAVAASARLFDAMRDTGIFTKLG